MQPERKLYNVELKSMDEESGPEWGYFEGYANTWEKDRYNDIIEPGAFSKTIQEYKGRRALFYMHETDDLDCLLGDITEMREDQKGLFVKGRVSLGTDGKREAWKMVKEGVISLMSIGLEVIKKQIIEEAGEWTRRIKELRLNEISLIPIGLAVNLESEITAVKGLQNAIKNYGDDPAFLQYITAYKPGASTLQSKPEKPLVKGFHQLLQEKLQIGGK